MVKIDKGCEALKYTDIELMVLRRHLKISFQEAAELIGRCSEEQWSAYEMGLATPPSDVLDRLAAVHKEFSKLFSEMSSETPTTLPAYAKLPEFKAFFGADSSRLSWRVYHAVTHQLFVTHGFSLSIEIQTLPDDSPLLKINRHL